MYSNNGRLVTRNKPQQIKAPFITQLNVQNAIMQEEIALLSL